MSGVAADAEWRFFFFLSKSSFSEVFFAATKQTHTLQLPSSAHSMAAVLYSVSIVLPNADLLQLSVFVAAFFAKSVSVFLSLNRCPVRKQTNIWTPRCVSFLKSISANAKSTARGARGRDTRMWLCWRMTWNREVSDVFGTTFWVARVKKKQPEFQVSFK